MFRVTRPYLNLLVKPRIFSDFLEKYTILCILTGKMPFKRHKKNSRKIFKKMFVSTLPKTRNTRIFLFGLTKTFPSFVLNLLAFGLQCSQVCAPITGSVVDEITWEIKLAA